MNKNDLFGITDTTIKMDSNPPLKTTDIKMGKGKKKHLDELGYTDKIVEYMKRKMKGAKIVSKYESFANPYSLISISNSESKYTSRIHNIQVSIVSNVKPVPIGRAYYKLWEIMKEFDIIPLDKSIVSGNIAEGPGGFINAIIDYRKKYGKEYESNKIFGITLTETSSRLVFESNDVKEFMKKYRNDLNIITISHGANKTGDINKLENILEFAKYFEKKDKGADIITADGGIDTDKQKDIQEQLSSQLLFNQIMTTLTIQKKGGNAVIKCYTILTKLTMDCIYLLTTFYKEVYITKPVTSKIMNNERYLVCKNFSPPKNKKKILLELYKITENWSDDTNGFISKQIPKTFFELIKKNNINIHKYYFKTIDNIFKYSNYDTKQLRDIVDENKNIAEKWCKEYDLSINK
jgi:23S rRNA U2552 (ribose-2'-O)-methylase RlmE/FtsJ